MDRIRYNGIVRPGVRLSYQGTSVYGAHQTADGQRIFPLENDVLTSLEFRITAGGRTFDMSGRERSGRPYYSVGTYQMDGVAAADLNLMIEAADGPISTGTVDPRITLTLVVRIKPFFYQMLGWFTRNARDTFNFARPDSEAAILASLGPRPTRPYLRRNEVRRLNHVPCTLIDCQVTATGNPAQPPQVLLSIAVDFNRLADADRDEAIRIMITADYTRFYELVPSDRLHPWFGHQSACRPDSSVTRIDPIERSLRTWELNIMHYLLNCTDLTRGSRIRNEILARARMDLVSGLGSGPEILQAIRDDIDARLITANHWGEDREDRVSESFQFLLSNVFGNILHDKKYASPKWFLGQVMGLMGLSMDDQARSALILQYGIGHCGEHAMVAYQVLEQLRTGGSHTARTRAETLFPYFVRTGNATSIMSS